MDKIKIGLIGTGLIAKYHLQAYRDTKVPCEVVALCDVELSKAEEFASTNGLSDVRIFSDYKQLLDSKLVDAISICTSNDMHKPIALYAIDKGIHILCEKPLGLDYRETLEMADAAESSKVKNLTGFTYRHIPAISLIKQLVDSGELGDIRHFKGRFFADRMAPAEAPLEWRHLKEYAGTGVIGDLASHLLDMCLYLLEAPCGKITSLLSSTSIVIPKRKNALTGEMVNVTTDEICYVLAKMEKGTDVILENSRYSPFEMNIHISGSKGSIKYNMQKYNEIELSLKTSIAGYFDEYRTVVVPNDILPKEVSQQDRMVRQMTYFLNCLNEDIMPFPDFREGARIQNILDMIAKSAVTETRIFL